MVKPKKYSRLTEVKAYLMEIGVESGSDLPYGNGLGRTIPLGGKYDGTLVNCFDTGTVDVQGSCDNLDEIKGVLQNKFPKKKK